MSNASGSSSGAMKAHATRNASRWHPSTYRHISTVPSTDLPSLSHNTSENLVYAESSEKKWVSLVITYYLVRSSEFLSAPGGPEMLLAESMLTDCWSWTLIRDGEGHATTPILGHHSSRYLLEADKNSIVVRLSSLCAMILIMT